MEFTFHHLMNMMNGEQAYPLCIKEGFQPIQSLDRFHKVPKGNTIVSLFQLIPICYTFLFIQFVLGSARL